MNRQNLDTSLTSHIWQGNLAIHPHSCILVHVLSKLSKFAPSHTSLQQPITLRILSKRKLLFANISAKWMIKLLVTLVTGDQTRLPGPQQ